MSRRRLLPSTVSVPVLRRRLPGGLLGRSHKGKRTRYMMVDGRLRSVVALSTVIHETLHQIDHRLSEKTVRQLERAVLFLVIDNPGLFRRLLRRVS